MNIVGMAADLQRSATGCAGRRRCCEQAQKAAQEREEAANAQVQKRWTRMASPVEVVHRVCQSWAEHLMSVWRKKAITGAVKLASTKAEELSDTDNAKLLQDGVQFFAVWTTGLAKR